MSDCVYRWEKEDTNLVKNFFKDVTNAKRKVAHTKKLEKFPCDKTIPCNFFHDVTNVKPKVEYTSNSL